MAELADALDSGSSGGDFVQVQILSSAPKEYNPNYMLVTGEWFGFIFMVSFSNPSKLDGNDDRIFQRILDRDSERFAENIL